MTCENNNKKIFSVQVVSDLHLEMGGVFNELETLIPVNGEILILPGDIGIPGKSGFYEFFGWVSKNFKRVLYIFGNHEFYHNEYFEVIEKTRAKFRELGYVNIELLYRSSVTIGNMRFMGCTLWTKPPSKERKDMVFYRYNDYRVIKIKDIGDEKVRFLHVLDTMKFHDDDILFLENEFKDAREKGQECYVVSHHVPLLGLKYLIPSERTEIKRDIWYGNMTDQSKLILRNLDVLKAWFYGHTHYSLVSTFEDGDINIFEHSRDKTKQSKSKDSDEEEVEGESGGRVLLVSNQVGYRSYNGRTVSQYNKDLLLELPLSRPKKIIHEKIYLDEDDSKNMELWGEMDLTKKSEEIKKEKDKCFIQ